MNMGQELFSYWELFKKIAFTLVVQLLLALICYLKGQAAYENFMSFFSFLFIISTSLLVTCVIKSKDDKLAMMAIILQDIGIALQAMLGVMDNHRTMMIMAIGIVTAILFLFFMDKLTTKSWFDQYGGVIFAGLNMLAILVMLVFAKVFHGVAAWISFGQNTIQITEVIKFISIIFFSCILSSKISNKQKNSSSVWCLCYLLLGQCFMLVN